MVGNVDGTVDGAVNGNFDGKSEKAEVFRVHVRWFIDSLVA